MEPKDARKGARMAESKVARHPNRKTPPADVLALWSRGEARAGGIEEGCTVAEQTGNSSEHSIGTGPRCRVSSLSSTIFGNRLTQVSHSVPTTALGSIGRSFDP